MGMRSDEAWMYESSSDYRVGSERYNNAKANEWYAANDTRIGGSSPSGSSDWGGRGDTCSQEAYEYARSLGYDDRAPGA